MEVADFEMQLLSSAEQPSASLMQPFYEENINLEEMMNSVFGSAGVQALGH